MSTFTGPLTMTHLAGAGWRNWRVEQPLRYTTGAGHLIEVPAGFETDGASVPRPLWWFLPSWGRYSRAAVVHDFLCRSIKQGSPHLHAPTRRKADAIFFEAMTVCEVNPTIKWIMWASVRLASLV